MAKKKQGGKARIQTRTQPKYLGVKVANGEKVASGSVLVRQRGTKFKAGDNVKVGRDHSLYAVATGAVKFSKDQGRVVISIT